MTAPALPTTTTTATTATAAQQLRGHAVFVARCHHRDCTTQVRVTLGTRVSRPVMPTPLGLAFVPTMPVPALALADPGTQDWARAEGMYALGFVCTVHGTFLIVRQATGSLRPENDCDARCWQARHRACACSCGGARHGEARDTCPARAA